MRGMSRSSTNSRTRGTMKLPEVDALRVMQTWAEASRMEQRGGRCGVRGARNADGDGERDEGRDVEQHGGPWEWERAEGPGSKDESGNGRGERHRATGSYGRSMSTLLL